MLTLSDRYKKRILSVVFVVLCLLFLTSLFKNISYPLFWADESMTVMGGVRVLEFGYPKVHDGKNVFYDLRHSNPSLGIDEKTDAYIGGASWAQYYFAALGVKLAELSDDLYSKTAIIRITFALAGVAGLLILAFFTRQLFATKLSKTGFLALFVFFELISVPLVLHLRDARYYSLTIFFTAIAIFFYARYRILKNIGYSYYAIMLIVSLFLSFVTFSPVYFIFAASILLFESLLLTGKLISGNRQRRDAGTVTLPSRKDLFRDYLRSLLPVVLSFVFVYPLMVFFKTFYIAAEMAKYNFQLFRTDETGIFSANIELMWRFFTSSDLVYLAIFLKIGLLLYFFLRLAGKSLPAVDLPKVTFSGFLTLFLVIYFFAIARIPNPLFTRYFIPLQPVLALIIILDTAVVYNYLSQYRVAVYAKAFFVVIVAGFIVFNIVQNSKYLKGHLYEMLNQYQGPLDFVIPYIKENYANPENLVIATNYEETSFMYYLNAKVTVGYVGNNLEEDTQVVPDIIVYRKLWWRFEDIFRNFLGQHPYGRISFPVLDYTVNNIPELNFLPNIQHQFRTLQTSKEEDKVDMFVRK